MNDQFFHRYTYDEDQRLTTVKTSRDMVIWDSDLRNSYFDHGPLKRAEYGEDGVQGLDYVYTIQGWLKGINHPDLVGGRVSDPGKDGQGSSSIAYDAFGMILHYYDGDFNRSSGGTPSPFNSVPPTPPATQLPFQYLGASLYDGNISSWTSSIMPVIPPPGVTLLYQGLSANQYHYDELGRLIQEDFIPQASASSLQAAPVDLYRSSFRYDPNGNIEHLLRNGYTGNKDMDDLEYHYYAGTNRLEWIHDAALPGGPYSDDIKDQTPGRYQYDAIGELIADNDPANTTTTSWSARGKMKTVARSIGPTTLAVTYTYDGFGNRIKKEVTSVDNFRVPPALKTTTWYVHDASGNVLATYEQECTFGAPPSKVSHVVKENENGRTLAEGGSEEGGADRKVRVASWLIYGSGSQGRIATVNPTDVQRGTLASANGIYSRIVREKVYELKDHLGDVRVAISDMKTAAPGQGKGDFFVDVRSYSNNYAFGMEQPLRSYQSASYRYGYDGQEKDDELSGAAKAQFREYDPRIGRFMSIDPLSASYPATSPYAFAENRVVRSVDFEGLEAVDVNTDKVVNDPFTQDGLMGLPPGAWSPWKDLIQFQPPSHVLDLASGRTTMFSWTKIQDAAGSKLNLDYYSMVIDRLPDGISVESLFEYFRTNINLLATGGGTDFVPAGSSTVAFGQRTDIPWHSKDSIGSIVYLNVYDPLIHKVGVDDAAGFVSKSREDYWVFTTCFTAWTMGHPVSGNRQFRIAPIAPDGSGSAGHTFFTRGADRPTNSLDALLDFMVFDGADHLWRTVMSNAASIVNTLGGSARIGVSYAKRLIWKDGLVSFPEASK